MRIWLIEDRLKENARRRRKMRPKSREGPRSIAQLWRGPRPPCQNMRSSATVEVGGFWGLQSGRRGGS